MEQKSLQDTINNRLKRAINLRINNPTKALNQLKNTLQFAQQNKTLLGQWKAYENIGLHHFYENEMEQALEQFQHALTIAQQLNNELYQGITNHHLGDLYLRIGRLEKAKEVATKAYNIFDEKNDLLWKANALGNLGNIYTKLGIGKEGLNKYIAAYQLFDSLDIEDKKSTMNLNIGYYYLMQGQGEMALPYVNRGLAHDLKKGKVQSIAMGYGNLAYAYSLIGNYSEAFKNYQICIDTAQKHNFTRIEYDTYKDMSETYLKSGNAQKAMQYLTWHYTLRDSIIGQKTQARVSELEVQFETTQKEQAIQSLQQQQKIQKLQLWLLSAVLLILGIVAFLFIQKQQNNLRKQQAVMNKNAEIHRLEKELINKELARQTLEQQKIEEQLEYKTNRLTDFALHIAQKNDFSTEVLRQLDSIEKRRLSKTVSDEVRRLRLYVSSQFQIEEGVATFQQEVDTVNLEFNRVLQKRFPDLTKKDLVLCGLLRLDLQNKEIATIRKVSDNAIKMARYRLRKKFGLTAEEDIVQFLKKI